MTLYEAEFVPQAWVNDNAIEVDADGPTTWNATEFVVAADPEWRKVTLARGKDYDDILRTDPNAPAWVREWRGPFETYLREVSFEEAAELGARTDAFLAAVRREEARA